MQEQAPALWLVITTGAVSGLLASIVGYVLLGLPLVKVKVRHDLRVDATGARVDSCVVVANVRGRPVKIDHVWIVKRHPGRGPGMSRPKGWTFPHMLPEGESVRFTFDRDEYPRALAVALGFGRKSLATTALVPRQEACTDGRQHGRVALAAERTD
jgi:hypothetical protein